MLTCLVVLLAGFTQVQSLEHVTALPASGGFVTFFNLHPVRLVGFKAFLTLATDVSVAHVSGDQEGVFVGTATLVNGVFEVEHVDTFGLTHQFESFQTGGLVLVGGDGTGLGTRTDKRRVGTGNFSQGLGGGLVHQLLRSITSEHPGGGDLSSDSQSTGEH